MVWICLVPEVVRNQSFTFFLMKFKDARYKCCTQKLLCDDGEICELKVAKSFSLGNTTVHVTKRIKLKGKQQFTPDTHVYSFKVEVIYFTILKLPERICNLIANISHNLNGVKF